jgi:ribose transport system substrate-binding protein
MAKRINAFLVSLLVILCVALTSQTASAQQKKFKIGLSLSYYGNGWQTENMNAATALSRTPPYDKLIDLIVAVAGPSVARQNAQISQFVAEGCNAIVLFAISPTGLNRTLNDAISKGVVVETYSSGVDDPKVYSNGVDLTEQGRVMAQWLADQLKGKGNVLLNTGVAGTQASKLRVDAAMAVFDKYPGIKVVAKTNGDWSSAVSQVEATKALSAHPHIDGVYSEAGADGVVRAMLGLGLPLVPTTGEATAGYVRMLYDKSMQAKGLNGMVTADPGYDAALAVKRAVEILQRKDVVKHNVMPLPTLYVKDLKAGTDIAAGDNVFPEGMVPDDFFVEMHHPDLPLDLQGYLTGTPGPGALSLAQKLMKQ